MESLSQKYHGMLFAIHYFKVDYFLQNFHKTLLRVKKGEEITSATHKDIELTSDSSKHKLAISSINLDHAGAYNLTAANKV